MKMLIVKECKDYVEQHSVKNPDPKLDAWRETYVNFSGHFGKYGPHMFAAAPELYEALREISEMNGGGATDRNLRMKEIARAALRKARGEA